MKNVRIIKNVWKEKSGDLNSGNRVRKDKQKREEERQE